MYQGKFNPSGAKPARRRITKGTIAFYTIFFLLIAAFIGALIWGLGALETWLTEFEASQSTHKSQEVFHELFSDPDWAALYTRTGQEDTAYEGAEAYKTYMENLVGDKKLTMVKTSAGLDANREKYLVKLDKDIIGDFTMVNTDPDGQMPHWELDTVGIVFTRNRSIRVAILPGCTVYVNGVALDDTHIISTTTTLAEGYLPEGLHGYRQQILQLDGLLTEPQVTIQNANGDEMELFYDEENDLYTQVLPTQEMTQEIRDRAVAAGEAFIRYMLADLGKYGMQSYFDVNGEAYQTLPATWELWVQDNRGFTCGDATVSEFYRYSDELYSVRVSITTTVTRMDYTQKDYEMDTTFFFHLTSDGRWLVSSKTNEELQTRITLVKLRYFDGSAMLASEFVRSDAEKLSLPIPPAPEGKTFLGWFTRSTDETGKTTMSLAFKPGEDGTVYLPADTTLDAMDLYAQFK